MKKTRKQEYTPRKELLNMTLKTSSLPAAKPLNIYHISFNFMLHRTLMYLKLCPSHIQIIFISCKQEGRMVLLNPDFN